jgi:hypothetical protein
MAIDVVNPQPICPGGRIVHVERLRDSEPPPTLRRGTDGLLAALLIGLGLVAVVAAKA